MDNFKDKNRFRFNNDFFTEPIETDNFIIYQIGDLFCDSDTTIDNHLQTMQIELSFVDSGAGVITTNKRAQNVSRGDIYLSLKNDIHSIYSNNIDTMRFYYIALDIKPTSPLYEILDCLSSILKNEKKRVLSFSYIFPQMTNILSEITYRNGFYLNLIDSNLSQIIISLYRNATNQISSFNRYKIDCKNSIIYNIATYINDNLRTISSLSDLAKEFSYDYSYISKKFKQVMHKSMHNYFQEKKLEYAKQLLIQEHKSVTTVSEILNYSTVHNFSRAFKNYYGFSPQDSKESFIQTQLSATEELFIRPITSPPKSKKKKPSSGGGGG